MQNASAAVSGVFTVSLGEQSTADLSWGASAADLQATLAALEGLQGRGLSVSAEGDVLQGFNYSITFGG